MSEEHTLVGTLEFHSETGTEGGYWAFQENKFKHGPVKKCPWDPEECPVIQGFSEEHYSYEGLHLLKDGDMLIVYEKDRTSILWSGEVALDEKPVFTVDVDGVWVHSLPKNVDSQKWAQWFFKNYPADLKKVPVS